MFKFSFIVFISIVCMVLVFSSDINVYAQNTSETYNSERVIKNSFTTRPSIVTVGLQGGGFIHTGATKDTGNGGGIGLNVKVNINKYFATLFQLNYTYASGSGYMYYGYDYGYIGYNTSSHFFDPRILLVAQRETEKDKNGFVPWAGLGVSFNFGVSSVSGNISGSVSGAGVGFMVAGGFRYNIKKMYLGANVEYNLAYLSGYGYIFDPYGVRINAEVGMRF